MLVYAQVMKMTTSSGSCYWARTLLWHAGQFHTVIRSQSSKEDLYWPGLLTRGQTMLQRNKWFLCATCRMREMFPSARHTSADLRIAVCVTAVFSSGAMGTRSSQDLQLSSFLLDGFIFLSWSEFQGNFAFLYRLLAITKCHSATLLAGEEAQHPNTFHPP